MWLEEEEPPEGAEVGATGGKLDLAGGAKMARRERRRDPKDGSRRKFLQTVGATVPTLTLLTEGTRFAGRREGQESPINPAPQSLRRSSLAATSIALPLTMGRRNRQRR